MKHFFPLFLCSLLFLACEPAQIVENQKVPKDSSQVAPPALDTFVHFRFLAVGDFMQHGDQIRAAYDPASGQFDYEPAFRYLQPLIDSADLAILNLELTLNDKNNFSGYPMFRSPDTLAHFIKAAGFDLLSTANNHTNDNFNYGLQHTLDVLDSLNLAHTGSFRDSSERKATYPLIYELEKDSVSLRLAVLSFTYGTNGIPTRSPGLVNLMDSLQIRADIAKAKAQKPDLIVALAHWGLEYQLQPNKEQQKWEAWLRNEGVQLIIGGHPHVLQPLAQDSSSGHFTAYSLGNFISNQFRPNTDIGLVLELDFLKNRLTGELLPLGAHYIPLWRHIHHYKQKPVEDWIYTLLPISALLADSSNFAQLSEAEWKNMKTTYLRNQKNLAKGAGQERLLPANYWLGFPPIDSIITPLPARKHNFRPRIR